MLGSKSAVVITAHSDDNIACACTLMKLKDRGYSLFEITLTDSREGLDYRKTGSQNVVGIRAAELSAAAAFIGVEQIFSLDQEDLNLTYSKELMLQVVGIIRQIKPEIVFIHNEYDAHIDHRAAHRIAVEACRWASSGVRPDLGEKHRAIMILQCEGMIPAQPDLLVDVSDYSERKRELWKIYSSQAKPAVIEFDQAVMRVRGNQLRLPDSEMAEAFTCVKLLPSLILS